MARNTTTPERSAGAIALKRAGLTAPQVAKRLGLGTDRAVGHWRTGRRKPEQSSRILLQSKLGIPVEYWDLPDSAAALKEGKWALPDTTASTTPAAPTTATGAAGGAPLDPLEVAFAELLEWTDQATSSGDRHRRVQYVIGKIGRAITILNADGMRDAAARMVEIRRALKAIDADEQAAIKTTTATQ